MSKRFKTPIYIEVPTGTAPLSVDSSTLVSNLNVQYLNGNASTAFATASHAHGSITTDGKIGTVASLPIVTSTGGLLAAGSWGTAAGTFCQGNDARLSDSRPASDVYTWAKASTKPTYTNTEVGLGNVTNDAQVKKIASSTDNQLARWDGTTGDLLQGSGGPTMDDSGNLAMGNKKIGGIKVASFDSQVALDTTTGAVTVDWSSCQNYRQTEPTGAITYTFTDPPGPCHLQLIINSDGTSTAQTITWPSTVIWMGSQWTGANNKKGVINFWFAGTNYFAQGVNQA